MMFNQIDDNTIVNVAHISAIEFVHTTELLMQVTMNNGLTYDVPVSSKDEGLKKIGLGKQSSLVVPGGPTLNRS